MGTIGLVDPAAGGNIDRAARGGVTTTDARRTVAAAVRRDLTGDIDCAARAALATADARAATISFFVEFKRATALGDHDAPFFDGDIAAVDHSFLLGVGAAADASAARAAGRRDGRLTGQTDRATRALTAAADARRKQAALDLRHHGVGNGDRAALAALAAADTRRSKASDGSVFDKIVAAVDTGKRTSGDVDDAARGIAAAANARAGCTADDILKPAAGDGDVGGSVDTAADTRAALIAAGDVDAPASADDDRAAVPVHAAADARGATAAFGRDGPAGNGDALVFAGARGVRAAADARAILPAGCLDHRVVAGNGDRAACAAVAAADARRGITARSRDAAAGNLHRIGRTSLAAADARAAAVRDGGIGIARSALGTNDGRITDGDASAVDDGLIVGVRAAADARAAHAALGADGVHSGENAAGYHGVAADFYRAARASGAAANARRKAAARGADDFGVAHDGDVAALAANAAANARAKVAAGCLNDPATGNFNGAARGAGAAADTRALIAAGGRDHASGNFDRACAPGVIAAADARAAVPFLLFAALTVCFCSCDGVDRAAGNGNGAVGIRSLALVAATDTGTRPAAIGVDLRRSGNIDRAARTAGIPFIGIAAADARTAAAALRL